jgi:hypothetical protein
LLEYSPIDHLTVRNHHEDASRLHGVAPTESAKDCADGPDKSFTYSR